MRSTFIQYKYLVFKYVQKFLFNCGYASGRSNMTKRIAIDVEMRGVTNISLKGTCREKYTWYTRGNAMTIQNISHSQSSFSSNILKCSGHRLLRRTVLFPDRTWTPKWMVYSIWHPNSDSSACLLTLRVRGKWPLEPCSSVYELSSCMVEEGLQESLCVQSTQRSFVRWNEACQRYYLRIYGVRFYLFSNCVNKTRRYCFWYVRSLRKTDSRMNLASRYRMWMIKPLHSLLCWSFILDTWLSSLFQMSSEGKH